MKKIILILVTAIAITLMLPMRGNLGLSIHRGETWQDAPITAPFDIPLSKTTMDLEHDRAILASSYVPLFRMDTTDMATWSTDSITAQIFTRGVMPETEWERYKFKTVRILEGNTIKTVPTQEIYTPSTAAHYLLRHGITMPVRPNLSYDERLNIASREDFMNSLSTTRGVIRAGEIIVANGQIIDEPTELLLKSYVSEYETRLGHSSSWVWIMVGRFLIIITILMVNMLFFRQFAENYFGDKLRPVIFTFMLYILMELLLMFTVRFNSLNPYIVPLPIVAIYLITFFNMRVAIFGNITVALLGALMVRMPFDFFIVNFIGGMAAIFMLRHFYQRANLFKAVGVVFGIEILLLGCLTLLSDATLTPAFLRNTIYIVIGTFLMLGFYQAIYLIERLFGFVSELTLLELSDTNQKLLLSLAQQAPGTFQHSVQVANLAEGGAKAIGARPLLARCGALYHDIGKMKNPFYFVENLSGSFNPHNDLQPTQSAEIIRRHVTDGVETARTARIPQQIIDFIERHHGNSIIYFFYSKAKEQDPNADPELFRYPGANPVSKEVSICMMADAVEAASRSLPSYEKEPLEALVDKIIDTQIAEGLLTNSQLSFAEVVTIKETFKIKLNTIYHGRIAYPSR